MNRVHLAMAVAGTLTAGIAAVAQAQAPSALPDLNERLPANIAVEQIGGGYAVGFDTTVVNVGDGAFILQGSRSPGSGDMVARQVVGGQQTTVGIMRYITSFGHEHWHVMPFQRYELHGPGDRVLYDVKQGFCLSNLHDEWCGREEPGRTSMEMGLKPGGHDTYDAFKEGQQIPIRPDTAPSGRYTLVVRVDPGAPYREDDPDNNVSSVALDLRWPNGGGEPSLDLVQSCLHSSTCPPAPEPQPTPEPAPQPPPPPAQAPPPATSLAPNAAPAVLRMTLAKSYRFGRIAMRREFSSARTRTSKLRISGCRADVRERVKCNVRWRTRKISWRGNIWLAAFDSPPRWGYQMRITGRLRHCTSSERKCTRRLVRRWKLGGAFPVPKTS